MEEQEDIAPKKKSVLAQLPLDFDLNTVLKVTFFTAALAMPYIYNSHRAERNVRRVDALNKEVKDLRAEYITLKSEHMSASKQSDVAQRLEMFGIEELSSPPKRIEIED